VKLKFKATIIFPVRNLQLSEIATFCNSNFLNRRHRCESLHQGIHSEVREGALSVHFTCTLSQVFKRYWRLWYIDLLRQQSTIFDKLIFVQ